MKEIKAYVHANRIAEVVAALKDSAAWQAAPGANPHNLTVYIVKGSLVPIDDREYRLASSRYQPNCPANTCRAVLRKNCSSSAVIVVP